MSINIISSVITFSVSLHQHNLMIWPIIGFPMSKFKFSIKKQFMSVRITNEVNGESTKALT